MEDANLVSEMADGRQRVVPIVVGDDEPQEEVEIPEILPILTLRSSVLFPGAITPITVGRDKSIALVRAVNQEGGMLGAVLQRESEVDDPTPADMYRVGTAARIIKILEMPNGNLTVILNGLQKIEVHEYIATQPYFKARVSALRDSTPDLKSVEFEALVDSIRDTALGIINISPSMPKEAAFAIKNIDSKRGIINFICSNMELADEDRQALLEAPGLLARARKLLEILIREQQLAELKNEIQERVNEAGIEIIEARITYLAYAPEIAAVMLQRQQASAIVDARKMIVDGAVGMVEMALARLSENDTVQLDEERKAAMVSNLLVVLCGNRDAQPVVNSGSLY